MRLIVTSMVGLLLVGQPAGSIHAVVPYSNLFGYVYSMIFRHAPIKLPAI